jgi:hypothetical protein
MLDRTLTALQVVQLVLAHGIQTFVKLLLA